MWRIKLLTFLHRANAIIVIKFPGTPTNIKTMHTAVAKCNNPDGYPWNSSSSDDGVNDSNDGEGTSVTRKNVN